MEDVGEEPGECGRDDGAEADEEALHGEAASALAFGKDVCDEGTKWLHADVDGGIEDPEHAGGHPEAGAVGHEEEHEGAEDGSDEKVGAAAAEWAPGVVAGVADDGLDEQAGEWGGEPQDGDLIGAGSEVLVDGTHVGHLEAPSELNAEEAEAHIPDLPEAALGLSHGDSRRFFEMNRSERWVVSLLGGSSRMRRDVRARAHSGEA
ncbi:hypothetical protein RBB80_17055 [Tunturiibacter gelidiferens]